MWREIEPTLYQDTPPAIIEAIATQLKTLRDARRLIEHDGVVVKDAKDNAIEHPALATERAALKTLSAMLQTWAIAGA